MRPPALNLFLFPAVLCAQAPAPDSFAPLRFLVGDWISAEGGGEPGKASGGELSLRLELDGRTMVRRSLAEFPAQQGRPALRHEDLTLVFIEDGKTKALYVDNEGHVIHYLLTALPGSDGVEFVTEGTQGPRMRLTYRKTGLDSLELAFDVAPPGKEFANHVWSRMRRKK